MYYKRSAGKVSEPRSLYDLEERTARFGEAVIDLLLDVDFDIVSSVLVRQLVRSATSVGANYAEADDAESRKDFIHKTAVCKKEARETKFWLRMLRKARPDLASAMLPVQQEAHELHLIFASIVRKARTSLPG